MKYIPKLFTIRYYYPITLVIVGVLAGVALAVFIWSGVLPIGTVKIRKVSTDFARGEISGYMDLDNDGHANSIVFKSYPGGYPAIEYYQDDAHFLGVIRPAGEWFKARPSFCFGDHDKDSLQEVYMFTVSNDSILLNAYEIMGDDGHFIRNLYIDYSPNPEGKRDLIVFPRFSEDDDGDGFDEFAFIIKAGFSLVPRRVFRYEFGDKKLYKSENTGGGFSDLMFYDLDGDGKKEVIAVANALQNFIYADSLVLYSDMSGWILAYDHDLQDLLFEKEFNENKAHLEVYFKEVNGEGNMIVDHYQQETNTQYLERYDLTGNFLQKEELEYGQNLKLVKSRNATPGRIALSDGKDLYIYGDDLKVHEVLKSVGVPQVYKDEFDYIKRTGYWLFCRGDNVVFLDMDMREAGRIRFSELTGPYHTTPSIVSLSEHSFALNIMERHFGQVTFNVSERRLMRFDILFHFLLFLLFYTFFYVVFRLQFHFFNRRMASEQMIHSLQLQTVQNQLQPHFTFNVLNTIGSLIYKDEKDAAYEYLNHFSDMLRSALVSGKQSDWMIDEELKFIQTYVAMENLRFDNKFDFKLDISSDTDISYNVPKLMVQTFVENAVSHGLMHKKNDCHLLLTINEDATHIIIVIEDDGIGRQAAGQLQRNNVGHGSKILEDYMEVYNKINKPKFKFSTTDLFTEDGKARGTRVSLWIPRNYSGNTMT